jgi:hypothetical protein
MARLPNDAKHWQDRAEEACAQAEQLNDHEATKLSACCWISPHKTIAQKAQQRRSMDEKPE